jgi:glutathione S-transferase
MSDFVVHSIPGSPYGRAVLATLEEKGAPYRFAAVTPGTLRAEPHVSRHPFGKIPVLEHGDFTLYETQAILRYLDRILPTPPLAPADPQAAARMDQAMNVNDCYLFNGVANIILFQRVVGPRLLGLTPDEALIAEAMPKAETVFSELERLLAGKPYFTGPDVSLADILLACHIDFFLGTPEWDHLSPARPEVAAWLDRMNARPSLARTTWAQVAEMAAGA